MHIQINIRFGYRIEVEPRLGRWGSDWTQPPLQLSGLWSSTSPIDKNPRTRFPYLCIFYIDETTLISIWDAQRGQLASTRLSIIIILRCDTMRSRWAIWRCSQNFFTVRFTNHTNLDAITLAYTHFDRMRSTSLYCSLEILLCTLARHLTSYSHCYWNLMNGAILGGPLMRWYLRG